MDAQVSSCNLEQLLKTCLEYVEMDAQDFGHNKKTWTRIDIILKCITHV